MSGSAGTSSSTGGSGNGGSNAPTTVTIRSKDALDYLPEPDIFHDVAGHVPMHTDKHFAETLVQKGDV